MKILKIWWHVSVQRNHHQAKYENTVLVHSAVHSLNVPGLCFHIWPDDGSLELNHVADILILITIYIVVIFTGINYHIIAIHNGMDPFKINVPCLTKTYMSLVVQRHLKNPHFSVWNRTQEFFLLHRYDSSIQGTCKEAIKIADLIPNVCATFLLPPTFSLFSWYSHPKWEVKAYVSYFSKMDSRRMEWWGIVMVPGSIYCFPLKLAVKFWNPRQNYSCAQRHVNPSRSASQGANTSYRTRFIHYIRSNCHSRQRVYIYIGLATPP